MTPADEIRAAAEKLRALATAASTDTDGTPTANWTAIDQGYDRSIIRSGRIFLTRGGSFQRPAYMHTQHAAYAAAMDPTVGLALADLLTDLADGDDEGEINLRALAVARAINGTT